MNKSILALVAGALAVSGVPAFAQQGEQLSCLSQEVGRALQQPQGPLLALAEALPLAGITGEVVSYQLCQLLPSGRYVYQLNELGADGVVNRRLVDATTGALVAGP